MKKHLPNTYNFFCCNGLSKRSALFWLDFIGKSAYTVTMRFIQKTVCFACIFLLVSAVLYAQSSVKKYQIVSVKYDMTGKTRENALKDVCKVDTDKVFKTQKQFDEYLSTLRVVLNNQRVFKEAEIQVSYGTVDKATGIIPVSLLYRTVDTWNIIAVPYPKYNSNTGAEVKVKYRDYNFLGTMQMFDIDFFYLLENNAKPVKHSAGFTTGLAVPFMIGPYYASWSNDVGFSKTFLESYKPYFMYNTGVGFGVPVDKKSSMYFRASGGYTHETNGDNIFNIGSSMSYSRVLTDIMSVSISGSQYINHNPKYPTDKTWVSDNVSLSLPVSLGTIPDFAGVSWTPSASFAWNWDINALKQGTAPKKTDMIEHGDLKGPTFTLGHSIGSSRIEWIGNYRKGFSFALSQNWSYNFHTKTMPMPYFTLDTQMHLPKDRIALYNRTHWYYSMNGSTTEFGGRMRGIRDSESIYSDNIIVMNFDLPIKVFTTDFVGWGLPSFMHNVDFELQISPFVDIALGNNPYTKTSFLIADGYYSGGIEILGYPTEMRSIVGRISFGIDAARTILPGRIVNKDWRPQTSRWELFFGLGIFY